MDAQLITIVGIRLARCSFRIRPDLTDEERAASFDIAPSFGLAREFPTPLTAMVALQVAVFEDVDKAPFALTVAYEGHFSVATQDAMPVLQEYCKANAIALLFPYVRETIGSLTLRAGFSPLVMPPLNAQALADAFERQALSNASAAP
jgi:preprotein translocase subunit SecB